MTRNLWAIKSHFKRNKNCLLKIIKAPKYISPVTKEKVWNKNSHLPICDSVTIWMPIVGVFPSNSFSLVPLPWKIPLEEQHPADKCSKSLELCTSGRRYTVLSSHFRPCDVLPESCFQLLSYPRAYVCKTFNKRQIPLSCVQTDATFLADNSQHCWMLHVGSLCTPCCIFLDVVVFCCAKFETCQTLSTLQTGATLLANKSNVVGCYMMRPFAHPVAFCWMLLPVVAQSLKPVKLLAPCKRAQR